MTEGIAQTTDSGETVPEEPTFVGYPSGCPLPEAVPADGGVFRLTLNDPLTADDFKSHHEMGIGPTPGSTSAQRCCLWSMSVYRTIEDARHLKKRSPLRWGKAFIAAGRLTAMMGRTLLKPSKRGGETTHTEWWRADGFDPLPVFVVIE